MYNTLAYFRWARLTPGFTRVLRATSWARVWAPPTWPSAPPPLSMSVWPWWWWPASWGWCWPPLISWVTSGWPRGWSGHHYDPRPVSSPRQIELNSVIIKWIPIIIILVKSIFKILLYCRVQTNKNSKKTHLYSQIVGFAALTLFMLAQLVYCPNKDIPPVSAREDFYLLIKSRLENV